MIQLSKILLLFALAAPLTAAELITGRVAEVYDGDTLTILAERKGTIERIKIRLWLIDAPEMAQRGGPEAAAALARLVRMNDFQRVRIECVKRGVSYDRIVGECAANTRDLSTEMVRQGHALVYDPSGSVARAFTRLLKPRGAKAIRERELKALEVKSIPPGADIRKCAPWAFRKGKCKSPIAISTTTNLPAWEFRQDGTVHRLGQPFEALTHIGDGKLKRAAISRRC